MTNTITKTNTVTDARADGVQVRGETLALEDDAESRVDAELSRLGVADGATGMCCRLVEGDVRIYDEHESIDLSPAAALARLGKLADGAGYAAVWDVLIQGTTEEDRADAHRASLTELL